MDSITYGLVIRKLDKEFLLPILFLYLCLRFEILKVVKNSARDAAATATISFDDAVREAYNLNGNLKQYLDSFSHANHTPLFDNKRVREFRYKMKYEEPRVKVVEQDPLSIIWVGNH
ncbi:MAG: hypothetical protein JO297_04825 [Nitrososphaeraceae archaeon]|nr:hypothetical protein [Nitrososphaeraceae archaeon]